MTRKYFYGLLGMLVLGAATFSGCKKQIDAAYLNPNATVRVPIEQILPGLIGNLTGSSSAAGSAYGTANDGIQIGRYVQFWGQNTGANQFDQMGGATGTSDVLGSVWAMYYYGHGENVNKMILWGIEEKKWDYVGVGLALRAWGMLVNTNMYGPMILREAFRPEQLVFNYEDQPEVYDSVRSICRQAIGYLNLKGDGVSRDNLAKGDAFFYNGDTEKWKKFVYAVMARSFNHLNNKAEYQPDSVLFYCNLSINVNADNATAKFANTGITGTSNFYGPLRNNVGGLRQSDFIANLMNGTNPLFTGVPDPRALYLLRSNPSNTLTGTRVGNGATGLPVAIQPQNFWGGLFSSLAAPTVDTAARYIFKNGAPFPIITASEIQFMKAEAHYYKRNKAAAIAAYREGISLNFDLLLSDYNSNVPVANQITPANKAAYLANPRVVPTPDAFSLSHIMLQKYIALYGHCPIETWTDMRRYHYIDPDPEFPAQQVYAGFVPPSPAALFINNNQKYVYRARPRFNSEYLYNVVTLNKFGAFALDYHTVEMWFSRK
ncbi:MAG: SusD/RagB family nutrient-binding outer membrane lipoprotein [Bacteroidetes bacterium]|nr:MAG: SusD/RagB family nutrient-binding outer membrane lipoprotein [Bacteroidota bacterium]